MSDALVERHGPNQAALVGEIEWRAGLGKPLAAAKVGGGGSGVSLIKKIGRRVGSQVQRSAMARPRKQSVVLALKRAERANAKRFRL